MATVASHRWKRTNKIVDWEVGDGAVCIDEYAFWVGMDGVVATNGPEHGDQFIVSRVLISKEDGTVHLDFIGCISPDGDGWDAEAFRKLVKHKEDEFDREVIDLMRETEDA